MPPWRSRRRNGWLHFRNGTAFCCRSLISRSIVGDWARPELEKLAQSNPSNAVYAYWLSRLAYRKMDMPAAVALARKAVQLDPMSMKAYDQLGLR